MDFVQIYETEYSEYSYCQKTIHYLTKACFLKMVLKVTVQKQSSKQSLPEVSSEVFFKIDFLKKFATGKHLCCSLFLIK